MSQKSYDDSPSLYLIPTPIGNLDDITFRSLELLKSVDFILSEDTRESGKLLKKYNINKRLVSCHEFNEEKIKNYVIKELDNGKNIGLITDQGSPIISDPGFIISKAVIEANFNVIGLPGATAFVPALICSGLNPMPFIFYGFLNSKNSKQIKELKSLVNYKYTMIFYEAPHRIENTLKNVLSIFGNRKICVCRELSKIHEEIYRGSIESIIPLCSSMKGEMVIIVEGNNEIVDYSSLSIVDHVNLYVNDGMNKNEAIKLVAKERNVAKSIIYKEYHNI